MHIVVIVIGFGNEHPISSLNFLYNLLVGRHYLIPFSYNTTICSEDIGGMI